jgi:transposase-like protein
MDNTAVRGHLQELGRGSVEEALVKMYLAGGSVRRGEEDIPEALWGPQVGPSTLNNLSQKGYERIEAWRSRPVVGEFPYVYLWRESA